MCATAHPRIVLPRTLLPSQVGGETAMTSTYDEFTCPEREHHPVVIAFVAMIPVAILASAFASLMSMV